MVKREREGWDGRLGLRFDQEPGRKELRAELFLWLRRRSGGKKGNRKSGCVEINLPGNSRLIGVGRVRGKNSRLWFSIVRIRVQSAGTSISTLPCTARIVHASAGSGNYWNVCLRVCVLFASFSLLFARKSYLIMWVPQFKQKTIYVVTFIVYRHCMQRINL